MRGSGAAAARGDGTTGGRAGWRGGEFRGERWRWRRKCSLIHSHTLECDITRLSGVAACKLPLVELSADALSLIINS